MSKTNFSVSIPWYILRAHLEQLLRQSRERQDEAVGEQVYRLQGRSGLLKELANLPETLTLFEDQDEKEKEEREHASRK